MPRKPRILLIDNDQDAHDRWKTELQTRVRLTHAFDLEEAGHILDTEPEFATIAIGAFHQQGTIHAVPLIESLRKTRCYRRPIVGIAHTYDLQIKLVAAGCTLFADRRNTPDKIMEALGLNLWRKQ